MSESRVQDAGEQGITSIQLTAPVVPCATTACVETDKASRYLKALCNHFARKVQASYDDNNGRIHFPFGECELDATADALLITVTAVDQTMLTRAKDVVADHLVRFGEKEELTVNWVDAA